MKKFLFELISIIIGVSFVCSALEVEQPKPPTEAQCAKLISAYVDAWREGSAEKMYASFYENPISFPDFQKKYSNVVIKDQRPVRIVDLGKPYLAKTPMLWVVDFSLEFISPSERSRVRFYQGLMGNYGNDYGLRAISPYFATEELRSLEMTVNGFMSKWGNGYLHAFNPDFFGTNKTQNVIHNQFIKLTKQVGETPDLKLINRWTLEPIEYLSQNTARVYVELSGFDITLQIVLFRQGNTWRIDNVSLSAPIRTRDSVWRCVNAYLCAWGVGDAEKMFSQFHALQGSARDIFGDKIQNNRRPLRIKSIHLPVFNGKQTATVEYECLFYDSSGQKKKEKSCFRLATVRNFSGRWCLEADWERVSFNDEQQCKYLLDRYVQSWITGDAVAMQQYFGTNVVSVSALQEKIRREIEGQKKPKKFMSFNGMSVDEHGALAINFTVESQSGSQDYVVRFVRDNDSNWKINSVVLRVSTEVASVLHRKVREYVAAWANGDSIKMFSCFDDLDMTEAEFSKAVRAKLTNNAKPERLGHIDIPYFLASGAIRVPYTVIVKQHEQECAAFFTFDEKKQTWKFVGNWQNSGKKKEQ